jgi:hypothetical protein
VKGPFVILILSIAVGCAPTPPAAPAPRIATAVAAPLTKTWDAVIDVFASRNIPIKNIDRSSGYISTDDLAVPLVAEAKTYADCGHSLFGARPPTNANYNVRVKGDSAQSTVQVTVLWKEVYPAQLGGKTDQCTTKGAWESAAEAEIKARAEAR